MQLPKLRLIPRQPEGLAGGLSASSEPRALNIDDVFQMYAADVAARGLAMLGSPDEADDLVQDVFLRAFRAIGNLTNRDAVRPWLMTIAVREALRRLKQRRLSRFFQGSQEFDFEQLAAPGASQDVKLEIGRLFRVLDRLSPELRVAWVLRHLEGETTEKVAIQCGWSLSTTKRRIARAHARVLKGLGP
jgi:RNA polymerase sigma-70 factor (ECF subfamily)